MLRWFVVPGAKAKKAFGLMPGATGQDGEEGEGLQRKLKLIEELYHPRLLISVF